MCKQLYGGWSFEIKVFYEIMLLEGIFCCVGDYVNVVYVLGYCLLVCCKVGVVDGVGVSVMEMIVDKVNVVDLIEWVVQVVKSVDVVIVIGGLNYEMN